MLSQEQQTSKPHLTLDAVSTPTTALSAQVYSFSQRLRSLGLALCACMQQKLGLCAKVFLSAGFFYASNGLLVGSSPVIPQLAGGYVACENTSLKKHSPDRGENAAHAGQTKGCSFLSGNTHITPCENHSGLGPFCMLGL